MKQLKRHLNPATVLSCVALFVALSGAAYAAGVGKKSVKTQHLGNGAVTTLKLRNGAVTTPKLRNLAVTTAKLRNLAVSNPKLGDAAVTSSKLANGAVRSAALGGQVVTTGKLKNGAVTASKIQDGAVSSAKLSSNFLGQIVRNVAYANATTAEDSEESKTVTANCPSGKQAIGGGARLGGELKSVALTGSSPFVASGGERTGWTAFAHETGTGQTEKWSLEAFAICAEL